MISVISFLFGIKIIQGNFWFALTDFSNFNEVHVVDDSGQTINIFEVGVNPGDFASWSNND